MNSKFNISIIGKLHSPLTQKFGVPRQPNLVAVPAYIELFAPYNHPDAVKGLEKFSHIWVLWQFSLLPESVDFKPLVRPPRLGGNAKVGVFASRSMFRPNKMGMSVLRLDSVEITDNKASLLVKGADMVDGTPILDIKPYIAYSDAVPEAVSGYALAAPISKAVAWSATAVAQFNALLATTDEADTKYEPTYAKQCKQLVMDDKSFITQLIAHDPRPAFHHKKTYIQQPQAQKSKNEINTPSRTYTMRYKTIDVVFYQQQNDNQENKFIIDALISID